MLNIIVEDISYTFQLEFYIMLNDIKSLLIECMQHGQIDESNDQLTDCWIFEGDLGEAAAQLSLNES